jgi:hypothetical protein
MTVTLPATGYASRRATEDLARSALPDAPVRPDGDSGERARVRPRAATLLRALAARIEPETRNPGLEAGTR